MNLLGAVALTVLAFSVMVPSLHLFAAFLAISKGFTYSQALYWVGSDPLNIGASTVVGITLSLVVGRAWYDPDLSWTQALTLNPVRLVMPALGLIAGFALQFPLTELENLIETFVPISLEQKIFMHEFVSPQGWKKIIPTVLALVVIAPVWEELLFRGLILRGLRLRYGVVVALIISSVLFGLSHYRLPTALLPATLAGVVMGLVALSTRSTWTSVALHAGVNSVPLLLPSWLIPIQGFNTLQQEVYHLPLPLLLGSCMVLAVTLIALMKIGGFPSHDQR